MAVTVPERVLTCGVPIDDLLVQVADHAPNKDSQHQGTCPTCQAALAELQALWAPIRALAAEKVTAPAWLLHQIMAKVRELPRHSWYAVLPTPTGDTRIAARVVGAIARLAAEEVPQVSLALSGGQPGAEHTLADLAGDTGESATNIGVAGAHVVIDVQVVVQMGAHIPGLATQVRDHITRRISDFTGLTTAAINIAIVDVLPPPR